MFKKTLICAALALGAAGAAQAAEDSPIRFLIGGGLTFGGDKLATVSYTNGDSQDLRAGSLVQVYAGIDYRMGTDVSMQINAGYHQLLGMSKG